MSQDYCRVKKNFSDCIYPTNMHPYTTYIYCIVPFILKCFRSWFTNSAYCNHFHFWNALHPLCIRIFHFMNFRIWHSNPQISLWVWNTVLWLHEKHMTNCLLWCLWQICLFSKWSPNWNVHFNLQAAKDKKYQLGAHEWVMH